MMLSLSFFKSSATTMTNKVTYLWLWRELNTLWRCYLSITELVWVLSLHLPIVWFSILVLLYPDLIHPNSGHLFWSSHSQRQQSTYSNHWHCPWVTHWVRQTYPKRGSVAKWYDCFALSVIKYVPQLMAILHLYYLHHHWSKYQKSNYFSGLHSELLPSPSK